MKAWFKEIENDADGSVYPLQKVLDELTFDAEGLIPVIAQEEGSGDILMFAWMNREALDETLATGAMCYWSRSRQCLWRKGESSGHRQRLVSLRTDCDGDALLATIEQTGAACHTFRKSCFYIDLSDKQGATIRGSSN